ncbi:MAG TPA: hypothetical protein DCY13_16090, partial [Verrucomicrobiales bacterium]|nr:hypothetical protein [Verrucomicrobiales bacterium]
MLGLLSTLVLAAAGSAGAQGFDLDFNPRTVINHSFPAITNAPFIPAGEATAEIVRDDELVLGVVVNGEARAYPVNQLTGPRREIINDTLGGVDIA